MAPTRREEGREGHKRNIRRQSTDRKGLVRAGRSCTQVVAVRDRIVVRVKVLTSKCAAGAKRLQEWAPLRRTETLRRRNRYCVDAHEALRCGEIRTEIPRALVDEEPRQGRVVQADYVGRRCTTNKIGARENILARRTEVERCVRAVDT